MAFSKFPSVGRFLRIFLVTVFTSGQNVFLWTRPHPDKALVKNASQVFMRLILLIYSGG